MAGIHHRRHEGASVNPFSEWLLRRRVRRVVAILEAIEAERKMDLISPRCVCGHRLHMHFGSAQGPGGLCVPLEHTPWVMPTFCGCTGFRRHPDNAVAPPDPVGTALLRGVLDAPGGSRSDADPKTVPEGGVPPENAS